jgi:hypothetical protein
VAGDQLTRDRHTPSTSSQQYKGFVPSVLSAQQKVDMSSTEIPQNDFVLAIQQQVPSAINNHLIYTLFKPQRKEGLNPSSAQLPIERFRLLECSFLCSIMNQFRSPLSLSTM